jgi:hypothetical protein
LSECGFSLTLELRSGSSPLEGEGKYTEAIFGFGFSSPLEGERWPKAGVRVHF